MPKDMTTGDWIAVYAAVVATAAVAMQLVEYLRNGARLKVMVVAGPPVLNPMGNRATRDMVELRVLNIGRRPIRVTAVGFTLADGSSVYFDHEDVETAVLPITLEEWQDFRLIWVADVLRERGISRGPARVVWAQDASGRRHSARLTSEQTEGIAEVCKQPSRTGAPQGADADP
jgi:hypothetical protein